MSKKTVKSIFSKPNVREVEAIIANREFFSVLVSLERSAPASWASGHASVVPLLAFSLCRLCRARRYQPSYMVSSGLYEITAYAIWRHRTTVEPQPWQRG